MSREEYDRTFSAEGSVNLSEILNQLKQWMSTGRSMDEAASLVVDNVIKDPSQRFRVVLSVLALSRVDRMARLLGVIDRAENRLYSEDTIKSATTTQLIAITRMASEEVENTTQLVKALTDEAKSLHIDKSTVYNITSNELKLPETPVERAQLTEVIKKFMSRLGSVPDIRTIPSTTTKK